MATGEPKTHGTPATSSSIPVASAVPSVMPSYSEMIMSAIEALKEQNGSNKSSIARHIESTYGNLPQAHSTLLTHHLNRMKASGQLVLFKNNYLKPDPNAPPRRGRGRPPKPKSDLPPAGIVLSSPRPRGRPPKPRDPFAPISPPKKTGSDPSGSGRKRGRPPKFPKVLPTQEEATGGGATPPSGPSRGRGRPPKVKPAMAATVGA